MRSTPTRLALVLSGGGARAAYQVGFLRFLATQFPHIAPNILAGTSAGAVNAAYLAAHTGSFRQKADDLAGLWGSLRMDQVFRVDPSCLALYGSKREFRTRCEGPIAVRGARSAPKRDWLTSQGLSPSPLRWEGYQGWSPWLVL
jgi:predicted acylesterase/phospholipase RssA